MRKSNFESNKACVIIVAATVLEPLVQISLNVMHSEPRVPLSNLTSCPYFQPQQPLWKIQKKLQGSVESRLQSLLERTLGASLAVSACSFPQAILPPHIFDQDLRGEHLELERTILIRDKKISTQILIDTGASGYAFISDSFALTHDLPLTPLSISIALKTFDGRPVVSGNMTHKTILDLSIGMHCKRMPLLVTCLGHDPIVLGIP